MMKVALVHDYIKEYGGAERVLEALHEIWPEAPVYTSLYLPEFLGPHKKRFEGWKIVTSIFQEFPFKDKIISPLRIVSGKIFAAFDFSNYDLVFVSATGAYIPNKIRIPKKCLHICYCHTPPRYLYGYATARNWKKSLAGRILGEFANHFLRLADFEASQKPDFYIANSNEVRRRIKKFYRREATIVYPPVEMADSILPANLPARHEKKNGEYYLAGGRLARPKHIDLAIKAIIKMKFRLKIFGKAFAGYESELKDMAGRGVEFVGEVDDNKLSDLYRNCKALIYPSEDEDFGIIPVEVAAFGKPVIAFKSGGVVESVIEGKTGIFFDKLTVGSIISAIERLEKTNISREECIKNAQKFSKERFKREIVEFVKNSRKAGLQHA